MKPQQLPMRSHLISMYACSAKIQSIKYFNRAEYEMSVRQENRERKGVGGGSEQWNGREGEMNNRPH